MHAAEPALVLYLPDSQASHSTPSGPEYPALHVQSVAASLPGGLALEAGQAEQAKSPRTPLNVLAGQSAQAPELSPAPASHRHASVLTLAVDAVVSKLAQASHAAEPGVALNVPTAQAVHAWPSGPV